MKSKPKYCRNCHYPLLPQAKYCSQCSQKYTTGKIAIKDLVQEFLEDHLNFDSKLFKTALALLIPGKLTAEYFKGRHKRFASPLRLFLVTAIVLLASLNIDFTNSDLNNTIISDIREELAQQQIRSQLKDAQGQVKTTFQHQKVDQAIEVLDKMMQDSIPFDDTLRVSDVFESNLSLGDFKGIPDIAKQDLIEKSPEDLAQHYFSSNPLWAQLLLTQGLKVFLAGGSLLQYAFDKVSWAILLMMPFLAMILKVLYIRRQHYYVEHLIFSFHYHSFVFLLLSFLILSLDFLSASLIGAIIFYIFAHLFLSMKRVYGQGIRKTLAKFFVLTFSYTFLVSIFAVVTLFISFLLF